MHAPAHMADNPANIDPRFYDFVLFQAQNAGLFLGKIPNPATGQSSVNVKAAKSVIDSLEMLRDKTGGNLTKEEDALLSKVLENVLALYQNTSA